MLLFRRAPRLRLGASPALPGGDGAAHAGSPATPSRRWPWLRDPIAARLLAAVLLFSSVVTLFLTLYQLYFDYRQDVATIEDRLGEIERGYLASIGQSLWQLDERQLALQLEGILGLPHVAMVEVRETTASSTPLVIAAGERPTGPMIVRNFPIGYPFRGNLQPIGTLHVVASLTEVYRQLFSKALVILAGQGAKTLLVSLFIIYIMHRLVTRHLADVAAFLRGYDLRDRPPPLKLDRVAPRPPDELDHVVGAFNRLSGSLQQAYGEMSDLNRRLEADIAERRKIEEALRLAQERFRDYAEIASDWFWETGPDHGFTYISDRVTTFGFTPGQRIGKKRWEFARDVAAEPEKWRKHQEAMDARQPFRDFTYYSPRPDGSPAYVATSGKPIFDTSGQFLGYRGGSRDVTDVVLADRALQQARVEQLELEAQRVQAEADKLDLLRRLVNAQEEERLRLARELHDQVGQDLTGLSLGLKSLEPQVRDDAAQGTLRWLQSLATQMGVNLHRTAWELRPSSLDDMGLARALETYTGDWGERFGILVDFHAAGLSGTRLPADIETGAYRVTQEALTNVLKHAGARTVSLVIERHAEWLQIIVEDDGRGFDPDTVTAKGRLGLPGMRERVALMGGTLTIDSSAAGGTTLYVRLPLADR